MVAPQKPDQQIESGAVLMALEQVIIGQKEIKTAQRDVAHRLRNVEQNQKHFDTGVEDLKRLLEAHIKEDSRNMEDLKKMICSLVPEGDIDGHHDAHRSMIESAKKWNDLKFNTLKHLAAWGSVGIVIFFGKAIFDHIMKTIHG